MLHLHLSRSQSGTRYHGTQVNQDGGKAFFIYDIIFLSE